VTIQAAETVEGPFYGNGGPQRSDIREERPGLTLGLEIGLLDARNQRPAGGLKVDLASRMK